MRQFIHGLLKILLIINLLAFSAATVRAFDYQSGKTLLIEGHTGKTVDSKNRSRIKIIIVDNMGKRIIWSVEVIPVQVKLGKQKKEGAIDKPVTKTLNDACIFLSKWGLKYFIRPNLTFYNKDDQYFKYKNLEMYPPASTHLFQIELVCKKNELEFWIDDRFVGNYSSGDFLKEIVIETAQDAFIKSQKWVTTPDYRTFYPIPLDKYARPGYFKNGKLSISSDLEYFTQFGKDIPIQVAAAKNSIDIGVSKALTNQTLEFDRYYNRSAFDGVPESIIFSVPKRQYINAYIICALEDNPAKAPVVTARLTRYYKLGRGTAITDTTIDLSIPPGIPGKTDTQPYKITQIGDILLGLKKSPLYLVQIPLRTAEIQDLLTVDKISMWNTSDHFDFELTGGVLLSEKGPWGLLPAKDGFRRNKFRVDSAQSAVHVFGVTLEESPVTMICTSSRIGNVYYPGEKINFSVRLANNIKKDDNYKILLKSEDFFQNTSALNQNVSLMASQQFFVQNLDVPVSKPGWYDIKIELLHPKQGCLVSYPTTLVIVPKDKRKDIKGESPFGTRWYNTGHHLGTRALDIIGPLFLRAGLRRFAMAPRSDKNTALPDEAELAKYRATLAAIGWPSGDYKRMDNDLWLKQLYERIAVTMKNYPSCNVAMIFFEDGGPIAARKCKNNSGKEVTCNNWLPFPTELHNEPFSSNFYPHQEEIFKTFFWERAMKICEYYRLKNKNIRIMFGNTGWSGGLCAEFFRRGFPVSYINCLGSEVSGRTFIPEKLAVSGTQGGLLLKLTAEKMGYENLPVYSSPEWVYRPADQLGLKKQAEWYMRDILLTLALGAELIIPSNILDHGDCYYHSDYGKGHALFTRYTQLFPRPWYAAYAVLTNVLDRTQFVRNLAADSFTFYALEFKKEGSPGYVYTIWTVRGARTAELEFESDAKLTITNIMGQEYYENTKNSQVKLNFNSGVTYIDSVKRLSRITTLPGSVFFPDEKMPKNYKVICPLDNPSLWYVQTAIEKSLERGKNAQNTPFRTKGDLQYWQSADPVTKSLCLQLEFLENKSLPPLFAEYAFFKTKDYKGFAVPGKPKALGVRVKGNSGWGHYVAI